MRNICESGSLQVYKWMCERQLYCFLHRILASGMCGGDLSKWHAYLVWKLLWNRELNSVAGPGVKHSVPESIAANTNTHHTIVYLLWQVGVAASQHRLDSLARTRMTGQSGRERTRTAAQLSAVGIQNCARPLGTPRRD